MKKITFTMAIIMFSSLVHAELSADCKNGINAIVQNRAHTVKRIQEGVFSQDGADFLLYGWDSVAKMAALTCRGLKMIKLQRSLAGRLGLISQSYAEKVAQEIEAEALEFYNSQK